MKVSFDYDSTLSRRSIRRFAKFLIQEGIEVWIVTSRNLHNNIMNKDLFRDALHINLPTHHIHFTEMEDKVIFFKEHNDFLFHLDDDEDEIKMINEQTNVKGILCWPIKDLSWKEKCMEIINEKVI